MGYAVYEDPENRDRWAGYGVPAVCDVAKCTEEIDRGLGCKCEVHYSYVVHEETEDEEEIEHGGCGLFFCSTHRYDTSLHTDVKPKPDTLEWLRHILTDESWAEWRERHPNLTIDYQKRVDAEYEGEITA